MCPCPLHLAAAVAFLASFASWVWPWLRGKQFEMKLKRHDKCGHHGVRKESADRG